MTDADARALISRLVDTVRFDGPRVELDAARHVEFRRRSARAGAIDGAYGAALVRMAGIRAGQAHA
jgi:hypothetical protein